MEWRTGVIYLQLRKSEPEVELLVRFFGLDFVLCFPHLTHVSV